MRAVRLLYWIGLTLVFFEGCATMAPKKMAAKKEKKSQRFDHASYALMDDDESIDRSILRRGSKARGQTGY